MDIRKIFPAAIRGFLRLSRHRAWGCFIFLSFFPALTILLNAQPLSNGVDPAHLGKGDWIWQMPSVEARLNVNNTQAVIDYEKSLGMQWITVKCGDGTNGLPVYWTQFNSNLVAQAHAAGLKIFGWVYVYGLNTNQVAGEIKTAIQALNLGADGLIIDAETEFELSLNNAALATRYCQGIRASYPQTFLAYMPPLFITSHLLFPYAAFGSGTDAAMPKAFWLTFGFAPLDLAALLDSQWLAWQNSLTGTNRNAIKPIIPVAETDSPLETGDQILSFINDLMTDKNPASSGGYNGVSFWDCQERTADMDAGIKAVTIQLAVTAAPPSFQGIHVMNDGSVRLVLTGQTGSSYGIEVSSNLVEWTPVTTITNLTTNQYEFTDSAAASRPFGYYRARLIKE